MAAATRPAWVHACLYGCDTWSLTQEEERRLRLFENRVLRKVFGTDRNKAPGVFRKLRIELRDTFSLLSGT